jgi:hypothetical protein
VVKTGPKQTLTGTDPMSSIQGMSGSDLDPVSHSNGSLYPAIGVSLFVLIDQVEHLSQGAGSVDCVAQEVYQPKFQILGLEEKAFFPESAVGVEYISLLDLFLYSAGHKILLY